MSRIRKPLVLTFFLLQFSFSTQAKDTVITIHLRGVYETKITLLPLSGTNALKPIFVVDGVKNGVSTILNVKDLEVPGEFVIRFDYKETPSSAPYPSEKRIILSNQDLELWLHPIYCNNADSTWFQKDEKENSALIAFLEENARQKKILGLLQNFLLNYDDTNSEFYTNGITEYEKRRLLANQWIDEQILQYHPLFVSSMFRFQHLPPIEWNGTEADRKQSLRNNYFEGMDFTDSQILRTTNMKEWMDGYVNLFGELAITTELRDSLFTLAGKNAIEKAKKGAPLVYGWMVDYFFNGYESFYIEKGIKMLEPYLNDPNCMTTKRMEINRRLEGIKSLIPGVLAPDIIMLDAEDKPFILNNLQTGKECILLLFWSADCSHCKEMIGKLYPLYQQKDIIKKIDIVAISMDETETETVAWQNKIIELIGWTHLRPAEGLRSKVANDYYILGVPVMILLNAKTKKIIALPESAEQLSKLLARE